MKVSIAKALFNSYSYSEYKKIVSDLLSEGKSTGNEQSEDFFHYSTLNETRIKRLDKTILIAEDISLQIKALKKKYIWLVIAEGWCGDAAQILPIINKMTAESDNVELKIVFRDLNDDLMKEFLTNKSRAIPKLICIDKESGEFGGQWGPRPQAAADLIKNYKTEHGVVDEDAKSQLQLWYLHDKGFSVQREIMELMTSIEN